MTRAHKDEARQQVAVYGDLLQDSAVIERITTEEVRGEQVWTIRLAGRVPYEISARGVKEAALLLTGMWYAYINAKTLFGMDEDFALNMPMYKSEDLWSL